MQITAATGQFNKITDGNNNAPLRAGNLGELVVQELHGRYYETNYRQNLFYAYASAQAMSTSTTAMVGLQLWNPTSSGVNLSLTKISTQIIVTSASLTSLVLGGTAQALAPTTTTAATTTGSLIIGSNRKSQALATTVGTFTTAPPVIFPVLKNTAAIATVGEENSGLMDFEGSVICAPGNYLSIFAVGATAASGAVNAGMIWEEIPV